MQLFKKIKRRYCKHRAELICKVQRNPLGFIKNKTVVTVFHDFEGDYSGPGRETPCLRAAEVIMDMESKYGIQGTYNTVAKFAADIPDFIKTIQSHGHEIASHSYEHKLLINMSRDALIDDVRQAKAIFTELGINIRGHRSPQAASPTQLFEILMDEGYEWVAENGGEPYPYIYSRQKGKQLWRFPVHVDDWNYEGKGYKPAQMLQYWKESINLSRRSRPYTAIGIHPWVQSGPGRLEILDDFFGWLTSLNDIVLMSFADVLNAINERTSENDN